MTHFIYLPPRTMVGVGSTHIRDNIYAALNIDNGKYYNNPHLFFGRSKFQDILIMVVRRHIPPDLKRLRYGP